MTALFRVQLTGSTLSGASQQAHRAEVGVAFGLNERQLDQMLCGKPVTVSKRCDAATARKLLTKLARLDLEARIDPLPETAPAAPTPRPATPPPRPAARPPLPPMAPRQAAVSPLSPTPAVATPPAPSPEEAYSPVRDFQPMEYFSGIDYTPYPETLAAERAAQQAGLDNTAETVTCPQCGAVQPKRNLCRQCGLDMPRYLAAQAEQARAAAEQRQLERDIRLQQRQKGSRSTRGRGDREASGDENDTPLLGFGFAGRIGRLDYLAGSLLSSGLYCLGLAMALKSGIMTLLWISLLLMLVYSCRCLALRLHDTGRSGWLGLLVLVPFLGQLLALALFLVPGDGDDNDYGPPPSGNAGFKHLGIGVVALLLGYFVLSQITTQGLMGLMRPGAAVEVPQSDE
jgi:uncharacterized membrane protein YhaH (DUF805 family)